MKKIVLILLWSIVSSFGAWAQKGSMADLKPVFEKIKTIKCYSYESQTSGTFPNGKKDQITTKVYMDRANKKLCYKTRDQLVMLNNSWVFKADHIQKTASVFNVSKYNKRNKEVLPEIESVFQYDMASIFMDSVLMKYGRLLSTSKKEGFITYKIGFTEEGSLKEVVIVYNTVKQLTESIYFKTETVVDARGATAVIEILCKNYVLTVPSSIFDERQYFSIQKGKPVLNQFKNYKVYSVL